MMIDPYRRWYKGTFWKIFIKSIPLFKSILSNLPPPKENKQPKERKKKNKGNKGENNNTLTCHDFPHLHVLLRPRKVSTHLRILPRPRTGSKYVNSVRLYRSSRGETGEISMEIRGDINRKRMDFRVEMVIYQ